MKEVRVFNDPKSPKGMRVWQPVIDPKGASIIYPDRPSFLSDGRSVVVSTSEGLKICYLDDKGKTQKIFRDQKPHDPIITADGHYIYYTENNEKKKTLDVYRKSLDTLKSEKLFHAKGKLPGTDLQAHKFHPMTVSSDNLRIGSNSVFLGDGKKENQPFGVFVLDLESGKARLVTKNKDFLNTHLQYSRSTDPKGTHDLLIQMNHGAEIAPDGKMIKGQGAPSVGGVDIHVFRDDGTNWRTLPWGRDGKESLIGHQVWRGDTLSCASVTLQNIDTSYGWADGSRQEVVGGWPTKSQGNTHKGLLTPGAQKNRVLLSKNFKNGRFCHLCSDGTGLKFAFDTFPVFDGERAGMQVYVGSAKDLKTPLKFRYLLNSRMTFNNPVGDHCHAHPILSPDGSMLLFNSAISGTRQFYLVTDFKY